MVPRGEKPFAIVSKDLTHPPTGKAARAILRGYELNHYTDAGDTEENVKDITFKRRLRQNSALSEVFLDGHYSSRIRC
jgi:sulfopyruvate decarboxylase TPP-binding subunit